mgnify:CR=1 FL=1
MSNTTIKHGTREWTLDLGEHANSAEGANQHEATSVYFEPGGISVNIDPYTHFEPSMSTFIPIEVVVSMLRHAGYVVEKK